MVALAGVMFTVGTTSATAATRIVQIPQGERLFVAQNLGNVNAGDTITWNNNDVHDVVAARIPATATTFARPIMSGSTATYSQTPTVPGNDR